MYIFATKKQQQSMEIFGEIRLAALGIFNTSASKKCKKLSFPQMPYLFYCFFTCVNLCILLHNFL